MKSPTEEVSSSSPWNSLASSAFSARLRPVLTGSMNTRSVMSRSEQSFSITCIGVGAVRPSSAMSTRRGPKKPMWT